MWKSIRTPTPYEICANDESFQTCKQLIADVRAAGSWRLYALRPHKDFLSLRTLAARGRAKPDLLMKRVVDLPDGVAFKVLEYMYGTAGTRVPEITPPTHVTTPSEEPDEVLRKAIRALSETLRISDREAVELLLSSQHA